MALGDEDPDARKAAAGALSKLGDRTWLPLVRGDEEDFFRLGQSGDNRAARPLGNALRITSDHGSSAEAAARGLGELGDAQAAKELIKALGRHGSWVSASIAEALVKLGDRTAIPKLVKELEHTMDLTVNDERVRIAAALYELGEPKWQEWLKGNVREDMLRLARSGDPEAVDVLFRAFPHMQPATDDKRDAMHALAETGDKRAIPLIEKVLDHYDSYGGPEDCVRAAKQSLARLKGQ